MNYRLSNPGDEAYEKEGLLAMMKRFWPLVKDEKVPMIVSFATILLGAALLLLSPYIIGRAIDEYIVARDFAGVIRSAELLMVIFLAALATGYIQTRVMGGVGQRVLFRLRNAIFNKLEELPVAFFNENKAGDLISRINNDTDKLNQFFSQGLMQFVGNAFVILGAGIFMVYIHVRLGSAALVPAVLLVLVTQVLSPWIKRQNSKNLQTTGGLSANIQESLDNFKVIVAFNRRDYFKTRLSESNEVNYKASVYAGIANGIFVPLYGFCSGLAQLIVIGYGTYLITVGDLTLGLLISFLSYVARFYDPLRMMASVWSSFQLALAAWDRISAILSLESTMKLVTSEAVSGAKVLLEFQNVRFGYPDGKEILHGVNLALEKGKTYALVGPTGGGKTTTASLMARLYDPTEGTVFLHGKDLKSYEPSERSKKIGFILQEPFLFTGTVKENILYGNDEFQGHSSEDLGKVLAETGLDKLMTRFEKGLETPVASSGDATSLGQRQLIAFLRIALRKPELLILDEATANIDTVTEQILEDIIAHLPPETTRVIIAHRLNTIENADEIYFVNAGEVVRAGSMDQAVNMLMAGKRSS